MTSLASQHLLRIEPLRPDDPTGRTRGTAAGFRDGRALRGTAVASIWEYNRATRAWDRSYLLATDRGGFPIVPGDVLWVVASVAETVGD